MVDSAFGSRMVENDSPVDEYVLSSTPEMRAPSEIGKVDLACDTVMSWSTTDCEQGGSDRRVNGARELRARV